VRYAFIRARAREFRATAMCRVPEVSKAGYSAWVRRQQQPPGPRARATRRLALEIRAVHRASRRTYGSPRAHAELRARGIACSEARVARLMRREGLRAKPRGRRFRVTTDSRHAHPVAANLLDRRFAVSEIGGADRVWAADLTQVPTREGWLYLAVVLGLLSRRVIGWAMRHTAERSLTLAALRMALRHRRPAPGMLHHSDRGSQYACGDYQLLLSAHGMRCSRSKKGDCWGNAVAESFFATLETELVSDAHWATREEARLAIFEYIEAWYNRQRRHSTLGYISPAQYEQQHEAQQLHAA
jgi:transposase InsO family protein